MGESSKFSKSLTLEIKTLKLAVNNAYKILIISSLSGQLTLDKLKITLISYYILPNSVY